MCKYRIIRSSPIAVEDLGGVLNSLREELSVHRFETWRSSKSEWIELIGKSLLELSAFESLHEVGLRTYAEEVASEERLEELWKLCERVKSRAGGIMWTALIDPTTSECQATDWSDDCSFIAGSCPDGHYIAISVNTSSRFWNDVHARRDLFSKAIDLLNLEQRIKVDACDGNFTLVAMPPLKLRFRFIRPGNLNPTELNVVGISSLEETLERTRAAKDGLALRALAASFACTLGLEQYELVRDSLNALQSGWHLDVLGSLSASAEHVLSGRAFSNRMPTWIPAFRWYEDAGKAKNLGAVVFENGQWHVDIATDGGTLEMLQERVAFLEDVDFTPIFP